MQKTRGSRNEPAADGPEMAAACRRRHPGERVIRPARVLRHERTRRRSYARKGQVHELSLTQGMVPRSCRVAGHGQRDHRAADHASSGARWAAGPARRCSTRQCPRRCEEGAGAPSFQVSSGHALRLCASAWQPVWPRRSTTRESVRCSRRGRTRGALLRRASARRARGPPPGARPEASRMPRRPAPTPTAPTRPAPPRRARRWAPLARPSTGSPGLSRARSP